MPVFSDGLRCSHAHFQRYMVEMIKDRQLSKKEERYDLFTSLLDANVDEVEGAKLADSELIGKIQVQNVERQGSDFCFRQYFHLSSRWPRGYSFQASFLNFPNFRIKHVDHCTYFVLRICFASALSGGTRDPVSAHQDSPS